MSNLQDYYTNEYLVESTRLPGDSGQDNNSQQHPDLDDVVSYDDLEFDLDDNLNQETYYAGGDERPRKSKGKKSVKKESNSFNSLCQSVLSEQFEDDFESDDFESDDFEDEGFEDEGTVEVSTSVLRDLISQLQGLIGDSGFDDESDDEYVDDMDDEYGDGFEDDDDDLEDSFPTESWDGGKGSQRLSGDYSGKTKGDTGCGPHLSKGKDSNKGSARVNARPHKDTNSTGEQRLSGDYSGKARGDKGTSHLKGGKDSNKSSGKTPYKKSSRPEEDLFGV